MGVHWHTVKTLAIKAQLKPNMPRAAIAHALAEVAACPGFITPTVLFFLK